MKIRHILFMALLLTAVAGRADPRDDAMAALERGDFATAMNILKTFAEKGDAGAQAALAVLYDVGQWLPQDSAEAVRWYRLAAAQGDKSARYNLAGMYAAGEGTPKDELRAYLWLELSVAVGNAEAASERDALASRLTPAQIANARKMADACTRDRPKLCD